MKNEHYFLALTLIKGIGSVRMSKLLQHFKEAQAIWKASKYELTQVIGIGKLAEKIVTARKKININSLLAKLAKDNIKYITLLDEKYPENLKNIYDPPPVLFYKGNNILDELKIAIIGSRKASNYGRKVAERLAFSLVKKQITVISGMARGIDTHGHMGALKGKGKTIAVLGSGLDIIYPPENKELFLQIQKKGMVISEFPPGVKPIPGNFPQRNRVISGLSQGVVVVEAAKRSGSLITADLALEQGRELFAIPGNINNPLSIGTNRLIKKGAKLVTKLEDILEELYLYDQFQEKGKNVYPQLSAAEEEIIELFKEKKQLDIAMIIQSTQKSKIQVKNILLKLELKGLISQKEKKYCFLGLQKLLKPL